MKNQTILIVEDSPAQQIAIERLVKSFGFTTHVVSSGKEALEAARAVQYSAILMDINLPDIDGFECTRQLRKREFGRTYRVPIVAITAETIDREFEDRLKSAGMDDLLEKPFKSESLRKILLRYTYEPSRPNLRLLPELRRTSEG